MYAFRSLLAFVIPSLTGIVVLTLCLPLGRRRAVNLAIPVITFLGLRLAGIRLEVRGEQALLDQRPAVFVINHQSGTDPLIVAALLRRDVCGVAKRELRRHPLLGPLLWLAGTVFVDRASQPGSQALAPAVDQLDAGRAIAIAAEGHRSRDGKLRPFRPGAIWLAHAAGVPLVPLVLHNSRDILPGGALLMRPGRVRVTVLRPLSAERLTPKQLEQHFHEALAGDSGAAGHAGGQRSSGNGDPGGPDRP